MAELHVQRKRSNNLWFWLLLIILIVAAAAYFYVHYYQKNNLVNSTRPASANIANSLRLPISNSNLV
jgi:hypothetical protein